MNDSVKKAYINTKYIMELEQIRKKLLAGKIIEEIAENIDWKEFEELVKKIFEENDFKVKRNFRFKTDSRYEIDVLAIGSNKILCVDCKQWSLGRNKKSGLKSAVKKQEKRKIELRNFLGKNIIAKKMLKIETKKQEFHSLIVTLFQEDLIKENETFIVPLWKLNSFLVGFELSN
jgi:Holliday junction resolvase-like predicted endonuclease